MTEKYVGQEVAADSVNRFEVLWKSGQENSTKYSLVKVPVDEPFYIEYKKSASKNNATLLPLDRYWWVFRGKVDVRTLVNLSLVQSTNSRKNNRKEPLNNTEMWDIEQYGLISRYDTNHYLTNLVLPTGKIRGFLSNVWRPNEKGNDMAEFYPRFSLGELGQSYRLLPQKIPSHVDISSLAVRRDETHENSPILSE